MASFAQGALLQQLTSTATGGGTTTLTAASVSWQRFTGSNTQTVVLPDATTMKVGRCFTIQNRSTGLLTVQYNGGTQAALIASGTQRDFYLYNNIITGPAPDDPIGTWAISNQVDIDAPLALYATRPAPDSYLNIARNQLVNTDGSYSSVAPSDDVINLYTGGSINFQSGGSTGGASGVTTLGSTFTRPSVAVNEYVRLAFVYQSSANTVDSVFSSSNAVQANLDNPGALFTQLSGTPIGYIDLQSTGTASYNFKTPGATTSVIKNDGIYRFSSGAGGGAGGDTSFKIQSVAADGTTKIKGGYQSLSDGKVIATYDGSGSAETDFGKDLNIDLDNILASPSANTTYYLYVDKFTLNTSPTVLTGSGRELYPVIESNFYLSTTPFEDQNKARYLPIGVVRRSTSTWDATIALTYPTKRENTAIIASPVVYSSNTSTIGEVGITSGTTQGHLVDALFPTLANVHYYHFDSVDTGNDSSGNTPAINLVASGTPSYVGRGLYGDSIVRLDGINQYFSSTNAFFNPGASTSYSYGLWAKLSQTTTNMLISNRPLSTDRGFQILINTTGVTVDMTNTAAAWDYEIIYPKLFPDNTWQHIVVVYDFSTTTLKLYVNGFLVSSMTAANQRAVTSSNINIGATLAGTSSLLAGYVQDAFFVKGNALTDDQVLAIYSKKYANDQIAAGHVIARTSFPAYVDTTNLSWYNLTSASTNTDGSGNARTLTAVGTPIYTGTGILGIANSCVLLNNASVQYFSSSNSFFNPDDTDWTCGGWFRAKSWTPAADRTFWAQGAGSPNASFRLDLLGTSGNLQFFASTTGATFTTNTALAFSGSGWQHIVMRYMHTNNTMYFYTNSVLLTSVAIGGPLYAGTSFFTLGNRADLGQSWDGWIDEFFFVKAGLSVDEIAKIYSYKLSHNTGLSPLVQNWNSLVTLDDITFPLDGAITDLDSNDIYLDLSGQNGSSSLKLILQNNDPTGAVNAVSSLRKEATATALDAMLPLTHNLPGKPTVMELWVAIDSTFYEQHDPATYFKVSDTVIASTGTTLASVVGGSTNCILIVGVGASAVYSSSAAGGWTTVTVSTTYTTNTGEELITDSTSAAFTITLPTNPNKGNRIRFIDQIGMWALNNVTVSRNGKTIGGVAADLTLDIAYGWCELVYDGANNWMVIGA